MWFPILGIYFGLGSLTSFAMASKMPIRDALGPVRLLGL